jgi:hypothetical protein
MPEFGFGQPHGGIIQTAFVVPDVQEAVTFWTKDLKAGPFFLIPHWRGDRPVYRGQDSSAAVTIAMGFAGHMQIELIQPEDDNPSVYKELIDRSGYGLHHFGVASDDIDGDIARMEGDGYTLAFRAGVPSGGDVAYLDGGPAKPGMLELIEATPGMDRGFTAMWRASVGWDGSDPLRSR